MSTKLSSESALATLPPGELVRTHFLHYVLIRSGDEFHDLNKKMKWKVSGVRHCECISGPAESI